MCSLTLALTGLTTGLQVAGQYQQSRAKAAAYEAQAQAAYDNAKIQNKKGEIMAEQYAQEQRELDNRRRLIVGQQNAQAGASGIAGGVGSALDVYTSGMDAWGQDSINLLNNQRNDEWGNYVGEVNYRNQGNAAKANAKAAKQAGNMAMFGTLLSGAASMYGMKGSGGSSPSASTGTAQTPTAAGYAVQTADNINSGISGASGWIPQYSTGSVQGITQNFGVKVLKNPYNTGLATNGVYFPRG